MIPDIGDKISLVISGTNKKFFVSCCNRLQDKIISKPIILST